MRSLKKQMSLTVPLPNRNDNENNTFQISPLNSIVSLFFYFCQVFNSSFTPIFFLGRTYAFSADNGHPMHCRRGLKPRLQGCCVSPIMYKIRVCEKYRYEKPTLINVKERIASTPRILKNDRRYPGCQTSAITRLMTFMTEYRFCCPLKFSPTVSPTSHKREIISRKPHTPAAIKWRHGSVWVSSKRVF